MGAASCFIWIFSTALVRVPKTNIWLVWNLSQQRKKYVLTILVALRIGLTIFFRNYVSFF